MGMRMPGKRILSAGLLALAAAAAVRCAAESVAVDFTKWARGEEQPDGEWTLSGVEYTSTSADSDYRGALGFDKGGDRLTSPAFFGVLSSVEVSVCCSAEAPGRILALQPLAHGEAVGEAIEFAVPEVVRSFGRQAFDLSAYAADAFSIVLLAGSGGNWYVRSAEAAYEPSSGLPPPGAIAVDDGGAGGFRLSWAPVAGADGYVLDVWTNSVPGGTGERVAVVTGLELGDCAWRTDAEPVPYGFAVRAFRDPPAGDRVLSEPGTGGVDMADPPWLRCWRLSDFAPGRRTADLSALAGIASETPWTNGRGCDCFHAFDGDGTACGKILYNSGKSYKAGLYATVTNLSGTAFHVLSLLGSGGGSVSAVLPVRLDALRRVTVLGVAYRAHQVAFRASDVETVLAFDWAVGDDLAAMARTDAGWQPVPAADFASPYVRGAAPDGFLDASRERGVAIPPEALKSARFLFLRWRVPEQGNSAMMGISDVSVAAELAPAGLSVRLR